MNWDDFVVERAVVHYVPTEKGLDEAESPEDLFLTDVAIELDAPLQAYFRDKIAGRLVTKGMEVVRDSGQDQTVCDATRAVLADPGALVERSKEWHLISTLSSRPSTPRGS